ncbi:hypothetical protein [Sphingobacterium sp. SYP-B4668]|uniref:hypothetical protein n=1 Tax=Sphingobacterium sp. SYP-B4668 TaxID=2996035 RepID=UPI0022DE496F|nr:hypothetical protein [Sphingobacterium sp. SYP-B4668]
MSDIFMLEAGDMKRFLWYFVIFVTFSACKKTEENTPEDTTPVQLETLGADVANHTHIVLAGRILYLNNEKVLDHGFVVKSFYTNPALEYKYSLGSSLQIGKVSKKIDTSKDLRTAGSGSYQFYIETDKGIYYGESVRYDISGVFIDYQHGLRASAGEVITIHGDFESIKSPFTLYSDYNSPKVISYELSVNKQALSFVMPDGYTHGNDLSFYVQANKADSVFNSSIPIAKIKVLGSLHAPEQYEYYYDDVLRLGSKGLPASFAYTFSVILGNKFVPYYHELSLSDLIYDQPLESFRIGYYNGRDTVIFPKKITLKKPDETAFKVRQSYVHPGNSLAVTGLPLGRFPYIRSMTIGDQSAYYNGMWNGDDRLQIGQVPDGVYPLVIKCVPFTYISQEKVTVQGLTATSASINRGHYGEEVTLRGNFIANERYHVVMGGESIYDLIAGNGTLKFHIPQIKPGLANITLKYGENYATHQVVPTPLQIEVLPPSFDSFYPKKGKPGDIITLKGKGIAYARIYFGQDYAMSVGGNVDAVEIAVPRQLIYKGKIHIVAQFNGNLFESKETFELL